MTFSNLGIMAMNIDELKLLKSESKRGKFPLYNIPYSKYLKKQEKNHLTPTYLPTRDWIALEQFDPTKDYGEIVVICHSIEKVLYTFGELPNSQKQASRFTISAYGDCSRVISETIA